MSFVHSFTGFIPPSRDDDVPWNRVRSKFSTTVDGTFSTVETDTLSPLDTDPSDPQARNITVNAAPAAAGWFVFSFLDAADGESPLSDPVYSPAEASTPYFTLAEIRAKFPELANEDDDVLEDCRDEVEERLEHHCDVAFVPRTATAVVSGDGSSFLTGLPNNRLLTLTSVTDGTTDIDVSGVILSSNAFYSSTRWSRGTANLTIEYTHGYATVPKAIKNAAMIWTRQLALKGPLTDRATGMSTESGAVISFATSIPSGIPDVDQVAADYNHRPAAG